MRSLEEKTNEIKSLAEKAGLLFLGVVSLSEEENFERYEKWIASGKHSSMSFLEKNLDCRKDPRKLLPSAKSGIILGLNYNLGDSSSQISQYARLRDYHKILAKRGDKILDQILLEEDGHKGRVLVDTAPVLERALAEKTGSGFIGKNSCFISREHGSLIFLCEIITTLELKESGLSSDTGCGECDLCQKSCPANALEEAYTLNANRCFCYWSIEHRGTIPEKFWPQFKKFFFGCDICQTVCPHNKAKGLADPALIKIKTTPELFDVATMNQARYEELFGGTPMTRAKIDGLMRNALIAMTVTKDKRLEKALVKAEKSENELIKATALQIRKYLA